MRVAFSPALMSAAFVTASLILAGPAASAPTAKDSVKIKVHPTFTAFGNGYDVTVTGNATKVGTELSLDMTLSPKACPKNYAKGFQYLSGLTLQRAHTPVALRYVHGPFSEKVRAWEGQGTPGRYGLCAYLLYGSITLAKSSTTLTITG